MPAPTVSAVSPATLVAGAAPVTVTLTGTNFLEDDTVVSSGTAGISVSGSTWVDATHVTAKVAASGSAKRGTRISLTVTTTDGAVTNNTVTPKVVTASVNSGALDQYAANPTPGATPGTAGEAIKSSTETTVQALNPAYDPANETGVDSQQGSDASFPGIASPPGGDGNPGADADARDYEGAPLGDHTPQLPGAPAITSAVAGAAGHATVNWTAPTAEPSGYDVTSYVVTATSSDGGAPGSATVNGDTLTADVAGLTSTKTYTFTVRAVNAAGAGSNSAASSSVTIS